MTTRRDQMGGREVRVRAAVGLEIRAGGGEGESGTVTTSGYASVTNAPYQMHDWWGDPYQEVIDVGAFGNVLSSNPDVRLLINHEGLPLARTTSGTLTLAEHTDPRTTTGLHHQASLDPSSPVVQQVRSALSRGDLTEMSFMFTCRADWSPDYEQRTIREITGLYDVSLVTFPANPGASAQLNSAGRLTGWEELDGDELRVAHTRLSEKLAGLTPPLPAPRHPVDLYRRRLSLL